MCCFGHDCGWACFMPNQVVFVVGGQLCGVGTAALNVGSFNENRVVDYHINRHSAK